MKIEMLRRTGQLMVRMEGGKSCASGCHGDEPMALPDLAGREFRRPASGGGNFQQEEGMVEMQRTSNPCHKMSTDRYHCHLLVPSIHNYLKHSFSLFFQSSFFLFQLTESTLLYAKNFSLKSERLIKSNLKSFQIAIILAYIELAI